MADTMREWFEAWYAERPDGLFTKEVALLAAQHFHESGRQLGMEQANALWELAKTSEAVQRTDDLDAIQALLDWQVKNVKRWNHPTWDAANLALKRLRTPQPAAEREPLSEPRINQIAATNEVFQYHPGAILEFARDIEEAHGIGQQAKEQT